MTSAAFDGSAELYDAQFTQSPIALWLRQRVQQRLVGMLKPGDTVLELGCGTGEDAVWMARHLGVHVVATDASPSMLATARQKAETQQVSDLLAFHLLDFNQLAPLLETQQFDAIVSNFGALNCASDLPALAEWLVPYTHQLTTLGLGIMSRFCLFETVWHGLHGDFKTASRRWSGQSVAILEDGASLPVYYPTVTALSQAFGPWFKRRDVRGIGTFLPPSDAYAPFEKHPRLTHQLQRLDSGLAHRWPFNRLADHIWLEFERNA